MKHHVQIGNDRQHQFICITKWLMLWSNKPKKWGYYPLIFSRESRYCFSAS